MADGLFLRFLGEAEAVRDGTPLLLGGAQRTALLALLALRAPRAAGRSELIHALWGEDPPDTAANAVQVHVSALRRRLGRDVIVTAGDGYRLAAGTAVDVHEFARASTAGLAQLRRGEAMAAAETLRSALELWRGPPLAGLEAVPFATIEAMRLDEERLTVLEHRIEADLAAGRHREVVAELEALVAAHPLREGLRGLLMQALYRCGRQTDALEVYDAGRRMLRDELGLEPSPGLQDLQRRLLTQSEEGPAPVTEAVVGGAPVPALLDETVGRDEDVATLARMLSDSAVRLVTVLGPGGIGKTRVAIEVGRVLEDAFRDGVSFARLEEAEKPADVAPILCQALGVQAGDDAAGALEVALAARQMLLICDNFEHVTDAGELLIRLLGAAPGVRLLVTSRQALRLRGERRYLLDPLSVARNGPGSSPAVDLFLARAREADPLFDPDPDDLRRITDISVVCDGMPLALELAAARTRALTVAELQEALPRPLQQLESAARDLPPRHRTLRANVAWSVEALSTDDRRLLAHLTVFRGGFTLHAAAAVAHLPLDRTLEGVTRLLDHSLLRRADAPSGPARFRMYDTIREFAGELLASAELAAAQLRHAEHFRRVLDPPPYPALPQTAEGWRTQLAERGNLRQAVRWALASDDAELAADLVVGVSGMWFLLGPFEELQAWLDRLLAHPDVPVGRRCDALFSRGILRGEPHHKDAIEIRRLARELGDHHRQVFALMQLSWLAAVHGDVEAAEEFCAEVTAVAGDDADPALQITVGYVRSWAAVAREDVDADLEAINAALKVARRHHYDVDALQLLNNLCEVRLLAEDTGGALQTAEEGLTLAQQFPGTGILFDLVSQRGYARLLEGDTAGAVADLRSALTGHLQVGALPDALGDLLRLAAALAGDQPEVAATALGVYEAGRQSMEQPGDRHAHRLLADLPAVLGERFEPAVQHGRDLVAQLGTSAAVRAVIGDS